MKNPYFTQRRRTHTFVKAWTKKSLGRARTAHRRFTVRINWPTSSQFARSTDKILVVG